MACLSLTSMTPTLQQRVLVTMLAQQRLQRAASFTRQ
jgi:hypothetical protein